MYHLIFENFHEEVRMLKKYKIPLFLSLTIVSSIIIFTNFRSVDTADSKNVISIEERDVLIAPSGSEDRPDILDLSNNPEALQKILGNDEGGDPTIPARRCECVIQTSQGGYYTHYCRPCVGIGRSCCDNIVIAR